MMEIVSDNDNENDTEQDAEDEEDVNPTNATEEEQDVEDDMEEASNDDEVNDNEEAEEATTEPRRSTRIRTPRENVLTCDETGKQTEMMSNSILVGSMERRVLLNIS